MGSKIKSKVGMVVFYLVLLIPSVLWYGFVLSKLWGWFVVPVGFDSISIMNAVGLHFFISLIRFTYKKDTEADEKSNLDKIVEQLLVSGLVPAIFLGLGAICHSFM